MTLTSMLRHLRGNAVACLALFVAMGGTSYAAVQIANGSVTTAKLHANAVTSPKIKNGTVGAADLAPGSVTSKKVKDGSLTAADVASGVIPPPILVDTESSVTLTPASAPDGTANFAYPHRVTFPRAGTVLLSFATATLAQTCTNGDGRAGVYIDKSPVPKTGKSIAGDPSASDPSFEVSTQLQVTAGTHLLRVFTDCPSGDPTTFTNDINATWTLIQP